LGEELSGICSVCEKNVDVRYELSVYGNVFWHGKLGQQHPSPVHVNCIEAFKDMYIRKRQGIE